MNDKKNKVGEPENEIKRTTTRMQQVHSNDRIQFEKFKTDLN